MTYRYVAYTADKRIVRGTLGDMSEKIAVDTLERAGVRILSLRKRRSWSLNRLMARLIGVKARDVVLFSQQLAMLLEKGIGFLAALELSRDQTANRLLKTVLARVIEDVRAGSKFSAALAKHPRVFPVAYNRMMKVGEQTGKLEVVLKQVARTMARDEAARRSMKAGMTYPLFVLSLSVVTVAVLVAAVLPSIMRLFTEFNAQLPWSTKLLVTLTSAVSTYKFHLLGTFLCAALLAIWYTGRPSGRLRLEGLLLKLPVIGRISSLHSMSSFSRVMSMLLGTGMAMTEVIDVSQQSSQSELVGRALDSVPASLLQGQRLSQALEATGLFPSVLLQVVMTGEETNSLDSSFSALAEHYESEFDETLTVFTSMLEPMLMLFVGLIVGFIAVSVIMPIYSVYSLMG